MPSWKKLVTSGSNAALNSLSMSGDIIPSQDNVHTLGTSTNRFQLNGGTPVTVGGSGTANTMTRFSAATEVQNSTITNTDTLTTVRHTNDGNKIFVVSGSNGELLSVSDEISTELLRVNDTSGIGVFKVESSGTLNAERLSASTEDFVLTYNSASGDIYFQSSSIIQGNADWNTMINIPSGIVSGSDQVATTFAQTILDDTSAAAVRTTIGVDAAGTDNSTDVTLAGTPDYITISGQVITRNQIDLANDVTGTLAAGNIPNLNASKITAGTLGAARIPDLNASKITAGTLGVDRIPTLSAAKISDVEAGATADQTDAEIETAYNNQVSQVSSSERTAGTATGIRRFAPADIKSMIDTHETNTTYSVGDGGLTQKNFTTALKNKLDNIEALADVTDATNVKASLPSGVISGSASQARTQLGVDAAGTDNSTDVTLGSTVTDVLSLSGQAISGVDAGNNRVVGWDDSESKISYLSATDARSALGLGTGATLNTAAIADGGTGLATADQIHTFVTAEINSLIDSAPGTLNTLNELAAAIGDDSNFSASLAASHTSQQTSINALNDATSSFADSSHTHVASDITSGTFAVGRIPTITAAKISDVDAFSQSGNYASLRARGTTAGDVGLGNVTNESKSTMFSSAALTGTPTAPTAATSTNTTQIATTAFVKAQGYTTQTGTVQTVSGAGTVSGLTLTSDDDSVDPTLTLGGTISLVAGDIPNLNASKINAGTLADARIPSLNASKITAGTFDVARIPTLTAAKISDFDTEVSNNTSVAANTAKTGYTDAAVKTKLDAETVVSGSASDVRTFLNVADGATANAGTVTSVGGTGTVSGLSLSGTVTSTGNLTLGGTISLVAGDIPNLNASKITAGTFDVARIPTLSAAKISDVEAGATADQTDAEIETAYNNQVAQVSSSERTAGTSTAIKRFTPADIKSMIDTHETNTQLSTADVRGKISGTGLIGYDSSTGVISTTANNYVHPTGAGNKHIPSGGASGQFLKYSSSGTAVWATPSYTTSLAFDNITGTPTTLAGYGITDAFDGAYSSLTGTPTIPAAANNVTITLSPGAGIAAIGNFTTNQSSSETLTIGVDGVLEDLDTLGAPTADGQFIVATGAGAFAYESGADARTSLGLGSAATSDTGDFAAASHSHTFASLTSKPTTLAGYGITDALASSTTVDDVSVANLKTRLAGGFGSNAVQIGDSNDTITIPGNLTVQGTQTINNVNLVSTSNGVVFEGSSDDANETTLVAANPTADRTITLPNATGTVALTSDVFDGAYTSLTGVPSTFAPSAHNQAWSTITGTPTTISGYGITDAFDGAYSSLTGVPSTFTPAAHNQAWSTITGTPTTLAGYGITDADNYGSWNLKTGGTQRTTVGSGGDLDIIGGTNVTVTYAAGGRVTIAATDTDTVYTHPTHPGDDIDIDTTALTGATVISDLDLNITTDGLGHVTDANASVATRDLTLSDLGYTGATNANNYSHPNHSGDVTSTGDGATTIGANKVTHAKYQQVATDTIIGRTATGTGNVTALTAAEVRGIINVANGATNTEAPAITSDGASPALASGITAAEIRTLIGAGTSSTTGTVTNVTVGTGLDIANGSTTPNITLDLTEITLGAGLDSTATGLSLDLSELTDMTGDVVGSADELILLDSGAERKKAINEIKLGQFNNDQGWTSNVGDITSVAASTGLSGGGSSGAVSLAVSYLPAEDDRDMKPNTSDIGSTVKGIKPFFSSLGGMTGTANSDYQDVLVLDTYSDTSGGNANALTFDKSEKKIRHWQASQTATSWGTSKTLAYFDEIPTNNNQLTNGAGYVTANTQLSNEQVQDIVGAMVSGNTETNIAVTYDDTNGKLNFSSTDTNTTYSQATSSTLGLVKIGYSENGKNYPVELSSGKMFVNVPWTDTNTNTFRTVTAGGNTLGSSETLAFTAGTNVTISESGGAVTINSSRATRDSLGIDTNDNVAFEGLMVGQASGATANTIRCVGDVVAYYSSDRQFKDNIVTLDGALDKVKAIRGVRFDWNDKQDVYEGHDIGVVAQEVEEVLPELVHYREHSDSKAVDYVKLNAVLIEAVKELSAKVEALEAKLK